MWRLCRWLIGRNLFWNSIVNKPHINLVALALAIQRKMHLHGIKSSYKPCPFIHVNRIFYFEKIVFIDGGRTAKKDDDFISGKKITYFNPRWPWWTSSNNPQDFSFKDFSRYELKYTVVVASNCGKFELDMQNFKNLVATVVAACFEVIMQNLTTMFWTTLKVVSSEAESKLFCTSINSSCQSTRDNCSQ